MKTYVNTAFGYALAGMAGGVFYREFTKFNGFTGRTSLGLVHTHLFLLGMVFFLLAALLAKQTPLQQQKQAKAFSLFYNVGVSLTAVMLLVRGVCQVLGTPLSKGLDAAISGMAGVGHILLGTGVVLFFLALKKAVSAAEAPV